MMGPHESRLAKALNANTNALEDAAKDWKSAADALDDMTAAVRKAKGDLQDAWSGPAGAGAFEAFTAMEQKVSDRAEQLRQGEAAVTQAREALAQAKTAYHDLPEVPPTVATPKPGDDGTISAADEKKYQHLTTQRATAQDQREQDAAAATKALDVQLQAASAKLAMIAPPNPKHHDDTTTPTTSTPTSTSGSSSSAIVAGTLGQASPTTDTSGGAFVSSGGGHHSSGGLVSTGSTLGTDGTTTGDTSTAGAISAGSLVGGSTGTLVGGVGAGAAALLALRNANGGGGGLSGSAATLGRTTARATPLSAQESEAGLLGGRPATGAQAAEGQSAMGAGRGGPGAGATGSTAGGARGAGTGAGGRAGGRGMAGSGAGGRRGARDGEGGDASRRHLEFEDDWTDDDEGGPGVIQ